MSLTNFENLAKQYPEYKSILRQLDSWIKEHPSVNTLDPKVLARELHGIDRLLLAKALTMLVNAGQLKRVYKVMTPSGVLADGEFQDPAQIPEKIADRFANYFDTSESDVIPVFKKVA
jgi:hypothetical protein